MYCTKCGKEIEKGTQYCASCGERNCNTQAEIRKGNTLSFDISLILSYITSPSILVLRLLLQQEVRWSPSRAVIAYDMMLTVPMKIVVGILATALIISTNVIAKKKGTKNKKVLKIMNFVNIVLCVLIIMFAY